MYLADTSVGLNLISESYLRQQSKRRVECLSVPKLWSATKEIEHTRNHFVDRNDGNHTSTYMVQCYQNSASRHLSCTCIICCLNGFSCMTRKIFAVNVIPLGDVEKDRGLSNVPRILRYIVSSLEVDVHGTNVCKTDEKSRLNEIPCD